MTQNVVHCPQLELAMGLSTLWWIACGAVVGAELLTGSFYLLMLALGLAAGAIAAHIGAGSTGQVLSAAIIGGLAITALYLQRSKQAARQGASTNKDVNLDIGETVHVLAWDSERNSTVSYRGADWQASLAAHTISQTGPHRIVEVLGSRLILQPL